MFIKLSKIRFSWLTHNSHSKVHGVSHAVKQKPDVVIVGGRGYHSNYGGVENAVREIARQLEARHHLRVVVYGTDSSEVRRSTLGDASLSFVYPPEIIYRYLGQHGAVLFCVMHILLISRPRVSLVFASGPNVFVPLLRLFKIPVVSSLRAVDSARSKWGFVSRKILQLGEFFAWRFSSSFTANSEEMVRTFSNKRKDVSFIPNGSVAANDGNSSIMQDLRLEKNQFLLFAARLDPVKRLDILLEAHSQLSVSERLPLVIAGGHSKSETYQRHLESYAGSDVLFVGHLTADQLSPLMFKCRAFVLPSVLEGMSNSLLTAMATGRAVLASDIAPNADVLKNQDAMFKADDVDDLRKRLLRLCNDYKFAENLGLNLQRHAQSSFTWERSADLFNKQLMPYIAKPHQLEVN